MRKRKPNVLISTLDDANVIAIIAKCLSGSQATSVIRVANTCSLSMQEMKPVKRFLLACGVRFLYRFTDAIIAISKGVADDLSKNFAIPGEKIKVIYNPINREDVSEKSKQIPDHPWLQDKKIPIVLNVGRLAEQKDQSTLMEAFSRLRTKRKAKLIILGEGCNGEKLEQLSKELHIAGEVSLPGFVRNPYAYMKKADVFVLSSKWEGFGNVLLEAMACGTQVVSTNCPSGPAEILENGKYGRLVPVGDVEALVKAIEDTLDTPMDTDRLRNRATDFCMEKISEEYLQAMGLL